MGTGRQPKGATADASRLQGEDLRPGKVAARRGILLDVVAFEEADQQAARRADGEPQSIGDVSQAQSVLGSSQQFEDV
jgi:hypothetical protein